MGLWVQIREALSAIWSDVQPLNADARIQRVTSLTEAWQTEQRVSAHIRQTIPDILYEQMRRSLGDMANDDERHARLIQERFGGIEVLAADGSQRLAGAAHAFPNGPWLRLRHILAEKRELYECYRQEAGNADDPSLQAFLQDLRHDEERHQEQLIAMLTHLDAYMHETIT